MSEYSENDITAQLVGIMKNNPQRREMQISINRESYLDSDGTFDGIEKADSSPRIDLKYTTWDSKDEYEYFMEAKNLAENNWLKNNHTLINAERLRRRYITTGIDNFKNGKYSDGCLLGYILEGNSNNIIEKINKSLEQENRITECLMRSNEYQAI